MATIDFGISFTTQTGQRQRIKTGTNLSVMGEIVENQFISIAKTETQRVMSSSMAGSTFSSIRDVIQATAITFQRLVARTPIDEAYETTYKQTGKLKNSGGNGVAKEETVEHKPDNDTLRYDWQCHLVINHREISIKATDYPPETFETINDRNSIQTIVNNIVDRLSSISSIDVDKRRAYTNVSVNFENKNGHFAKLEYGYGGRTSTHQPVKGEEKMHGLVNGFSVQAPSGFFRISMIELGQILAVKGRANVSKRLMEKCYDINKSHKFFLNKMGHIRLHTENDGASINSRLKDSIKDTGADWSSNFNKLWKVAIKNEEIKNELKDLEEAWLKTYSLPNTFIDRLYEDKVRNFDIRTTEYDLENVKKEIIEEGKSKAFKLKMKDANASEINRDYMLKMSMLTARKKSIEDRLIALRNGAGASEAARSLYSELYGKSTSAKDYLSDEGIRMFLSGTRVKTKDKDGNDTWVQRRYALKNTIRDDVYKKFKEGMLSIYDMFNHTEKKGEIIGFNEKGFRGEAFRRGKELLKEKDPETYEDIFELHIRKLSPNLSNKLIRIGEKILSKDKEAVEKFVIREVVTNEGRLEFNYKLDVERFKYNPKRYKTEGSDKAQSITSKTREIFNTEHNELLSDINRVQKIKSDFEKKYEKFREETVASMKVFYVGKTKIRGEAAYNTFINEKYQEKYRDTITDYYRKIANINKVYANLQTELNSLREKEMPLIQKALVDVGYGGTLKVPQKINNPYVSSVLEHLNRTGYKAPSKGVKGTQHYYSWNVGQIITQDKYGRNRITGFKDYAFRQYKVDRLRELDAERKLLEKKLEALYKRNFKALHSSRRK